MRTFVIGDIHGCFDEFLELLDIIKPDFSKDKLILLGDYIDRGAKSYEMVMFIKNLMERNSKENLIVLKGNHEQMAIDYYEEANHRWFRNGAVETQLSFEQHNDSVENYLEFFKCLDHYHEDENFIYVHAGLKPGIDIAEQSPYDLIWIREEFYLHLHAYHKMVIFGHTPTRMIDKKDFPISVNGNMALDTACVYGGALSALLIEEGKIAKVYQVQGKKSYKVL